MRPGRTAPRPGRTRAPAPSPGSCRRLVEVIEHARDARMLEPREQPRLDLEPARPGEVHEPLDRDLASALRAPGRPRPSRRARSARRSCSGPRAARRPQRGPPAVLPRHGPRLPVGSSRCPGPRSSRSSSCPTWWATTCCRPDWQAQNKHGGLGRDPVRRRALLSHVCTYGLAFVPAFIWLATTSGPGSSWPPAIVVPHLIAGRRPAAGLYMRSREALGPPPTDFVFIAVDQSFHVIALFALALSRASSRRPPSARRRPPAGRGPGPAGRRGHIVPGGRRGLLRRAGERARRLEPVGRVLRHRARTTASNGAAAGRSRRHRRRRLADVRDHAL